MKKINSKNNHKFNKKIVVNLKQIKGGNPTKNIKSLNFVKMKNTFKQDNDYVGGWNW